MVQTPAFMPVGTAAVVKTLDPDELRLAGTEIVLGNTYHIWHHPGHETVERLGGLAKFTGWNGPTLTDSGGFQVFSLSATRKLTEEGAIFQSVYDGRQLTLTPEEACRIQWLIGADIFHALDECPPYPASHEEVSSASGLTFRWAKRFLSTYCELAEAAQGTGRAAFLVVQGGLYEDLRRESAEQIAGLNPLGFGIGGVSVGEPPEEMLRVTSICCQALPPEKPRHLLGVGTPADLVGAIAEGVDLFDCVLPTRNGRNGQAFTSHGIVNVRLAAWKESELPLDDHCKCPACKKFTMAYLHHLLNAGEMLGMRLLSLHNVTYYQQLFRDARDAIKYNRYLAWKKEVENGWMAA